MIEQIKKSITVFLFLAVIIPAAGFAAVVGETDDPMVIGGGARPLGMGRAFTAVADDADAPFLNPAGIAGLKGPQAMGMFTNLMGEVYYAEFCGAIPASFGTVGAGYVITGVNQIPTQVGSSTVYTDYYDSLLLLTYSTPLSRYFGYGRNVFAGINFKVFSRGFTGGVNESALGTSVDIGLKLVATPYLSFGVCRQNVLPVALGGVVRWSSGAEEAVAGITKFGIAVKPIQWQGNILLVADIDMPASSARPTTMHFGGEWKMHPNLVVRSGFDQSVDASTSSKTNWNPTYGISLLASGFRIDYAYHAYYNDLSMATSYVSLSYQGEPWLALKGDVR